MASSSPKVKSYADVVVEPITVRRRDAVSMLGGDIALLDWLQAADYIRRDINSQQHHHYSVRGTAHSLYEGYQLARHDGALARFENGERAKDLKKKAE